MSVMASPGFPCPAQWPHMAARGAVLAMADYLFRRRRAGGGTLRSAAIDCAAALFDCAVVGSGLVISQPWRAFVVVAGTAVAGFVLLIPGFQQAERFH